jgi:hypothetical protein
MAPLLGLLVSASPDALRASPPGPEGPVPGESISLTSDERPFSPLASSFFAPPLTSGFAGLGDLNIASPPNTHGAVGSSYLMEVLNSQVRVQSTTGAIAFGPVSLNAFWSLGSGPNPNNSGASDPRVVYDPFANRWVVVSCDEAGSANSRLLVGVSKTPIPDLAFSNWHRSPSTSTSGRRCGPRKRLSGSATSGSSSRSTSSGSRTTSSTTRRSTSSTRPRCTRAT